MTAMRGSRIKFFVIFVSVFLLILFSLKVFNNSKEEFDQFKITCEQQQGSTNEQMKVVVEQKLRLENSLLSERKLYKELQKTLENQQKINEEQVLDSNLRFSSLQQHFKLTKSQLDDLTADCAKTREKQMEESNSQNLKIKSLQAQVIQAGREKDKDIEIWKVKYNQMETEKAHLEEALGNNKNKNGDLKKVEYKNFKLERELSKYKENCPYRPVDGDEQQQQQRQIQPPSNMLQKLLVKSDSAIAKSFSQQIAVSEDLYKISMKTNNNNNDKEITNNKNAKKTVINSGGGLKKAPIIGIINSVENFQMIPKPIVESPAVPPINSNNVLQQPVLLRTSTMSSSDSLKNKKTSESEINKILPALAVAPTVSSTSTKKKIQSNNKIKLKLPQGVPPEPQEIMNEAQQEEKNGNNRYVINTNDNLKSEKVTANKNEGSKNHNPVLFDNADEQENGAHEDINNQDIDIDKNNINSHRHFKDPVHNNINNNAAEEDLNLYDNNNKLINNNVQQESKNSNMEQKQQQQQQRLREIGNRFHELNAPNTGVNPNANNKNDKLLNEIVGDHGKEYPDELEDDMPMDGQNEAEEDQGDVGEYDDPKALKAQGPAERN